MYNIGYTRGMTTRDGQLNFRLSDKDRASFERAAKRAGLSLSEWVRISCLSAAKCCPLCGGKDA
jgi:predicted HicB family RNase H-like nuclease